MTDIVERLRRDLSPSMKEAVCPVSLLREAAGEIERLRADKTALLNALKPFAGMSYTVVPNQHWIDEAKRLFDHQQEKR